MLLHPKFLVDVGVSIAQSILCRANFNGVVIPDFYCAFVYDKAFPDPIGRYPTISPLKEGRFYTDPRNSSGVGCKNCHILGRQNISLSIFYRN